MPRHLDPDSRALPKNNTALSPEAHHFAHSLAVDGGSIRQRQDDFLLTASHVLQNPHNYTPRHSHSTRYKEWYSSTFNEESKISRSSSRRRQTYMLLGVRGGLKTPTDLLAGLDPGVRNEIESRFSEMDLSQKELRQQLHGIRIEITSQDSLSALEKLRNELDALTANASSTSAEQKSIENRLSLFPSDFERAGSLATGLEGILSSAGDDSLQSTMEGLKEQISALASAVKDYSALTSALEDKTLSSGGLSPEVLGKVKGMVRSAVIEHWVMDAQEKVKADVIAELKSSVLASTRDTQQNVIVRKVSDAVTAAVNSNAPSQLETFVTDSLQNIIKDRLSGVDWLLAINGAHILKTSPSLDPCQGGDMLSRMSCNAKNSLATPVQLNPVTILKPDGVTSVLGDDANGLRLGQCWAMGGSTGFIEIQLSRSVKPRSVVIEHPPVTISIGRGDSAVKNFRVMGWNSVGKDAKEHELTVGEYKLTSNGADWLTPHIQSFPVNLTGDVFIDRVRFEVLSNHGNENYTCIYHIRLLAEHKVLQAESM